MKNLVLILCVAIMTLGFKSDNPTDFMSFDKTTHDFGNIVQGTPVQAQFIITNIGDQPLIINNIDRQCGCTSPSFNNAPIPVGAKDTILVGYNAAAMGAFTKKLTVKTNYGNAELFIRGTVVK
jgi:hypothetical protein